MEQKGNDCVRCRELEIHRDHLQRVIDQIEELIVGAPVVGARRLRGRRQREYQTAHGKLIQAAAAAKGRKLREVSRAIGYASDYLSRVCSDSVPLTRRMALLLHQELGVNLLAYVPAAPPAPTAPPAPSVQLELAGAAP